VKSTGTGSGSEGAQIYFRFGGGALIINKKISIKTRGNCDMVDITAQVEKEVAVSNINNGIVTLFISGSTAGLTTIEYEGGLVNDYKEMWDRNVPDNINYNHNLRWGDGNGHSHVRASLQSASLVVPFANKNLALGTWQQIIVVDFDNRPRSREVFVQVMGE
jgi:secondary thiamine-phosphate synthase enzyme